MREEKILITPRPHIGDFIWATSAVALLKKSGRQFKITVLSPSSLNELVDNNRIFDDKITYAISKFESGSMLAKAFYRANLFIKLLFKIRPQKFDLCFLFSPFPFFTKLAVYLNIGKIIFPEYECCGQNKKSGEYGILGTMLKKDRLLYVETQRNADFTHYSEFFQTLVRNFLNSSNMALPAIPSFTGNKDEITALIKTDKTRKIALCMKASKTSKNVWPAEYFRQIIQEISQNVSAAFFIFGGKEQQKYADDFIKNLDPSAEAHNLCGKTSLLEIKEICIHLDLLISVDTGIPHIAATTGINMITLFGFAAPDAVMPMSHKNISFYAGIECSPCVYSLAFEKNQCPYETPKCMESIKPADVTKAALAILERNK